MADFLDFVDRLKDENPIEDVASDLGLKFERGSGRYRRVAHSGGFIVNIGKQRFFHATQGWNGDVIELVCKVKGFEPKSAMEWLARRANIEIPNWGRMTDDELKSRRVMVNVFEVAHSLFQEWLWDDKEALTYLRKKRGFEDEVICGDVSAAEALEEAAPFHFSEATIAKAKELVKDGKKDSIVVSGACFGFSGRKKPEQIEAMKSQFDLYGVRHDHPFAVTILGLVGDVRGWADMNGIDRSSQDWDADWEAKGRLHGMMLNPGIVFAHHWNGQVNYLSRRNMPGHDMNGDWKSFNPQRIIVGPRQPYFNFRYRGDAEECVICEGPIDAESWGVWGYSAVALCGVNAADEGMSSLRSRLKRHRRLYVALDQDQAGQEKREKVAEVFGPLTRLVDYVPSVEINDDDNEASDE